MFSPTPFSPEKREGLKMELMINHAFVRKPPLNPNSTGYTGLPDG